MDFKDVNEQRFSCRKFRDEKVSHKTLLEIINDAILAPSAVNYQPVRFILVEDENLIEEIKNTTRFLWNAKSIIVVYYDDRISWKRHHDGMDFGIVDAALACQNIMLSVTNHDLGTTFVGSFHEDELKVILELNENEHIVSLFPIGFKDEEKEHGKRLTLEEVTTFR